MAFSSIPFHLFFTFHSIQSNNSLVVLLMQYYLALCEFDQKTYSKDLWGKKQATRQFDKNHGNTWTMLFHSVNVSWDLVRHCGAMSGNMCLKALFWLVGCRKESFRRCGQRSICCHGYCGSLRGFYQSEQPVKQEARSDGDEERPVPTLPSRKWLHRTGITRHDRQNK